MPTDNVYADELVQVVYHIATDDEYQQQFALLNLKNHLTDLDQQGAEAKIEVLLEGKGTTLFVRAAHDTHLQQHITQLRDRGVVFILERGPLQRHGALLDQVQISLFGGELIENGVLYLVKLQQQGYAYIPYVSE